MERNFLHTGSYLNIPVLRRGERAQLTLEVDGRVIRTGSFLPAHHGQPDHWLSMDLAAHRGKSIRVIVADAPADSTLFNHITSTAEPHGVATLYQERLRPRFHFTARNCWLNDPNGMVFHAGRFHLFYQHNALYNGLDNQSWGHSVSRDLFNWEEWPPAMEPYVFSKGLSFSGSAVIDRQNRAGFGANAFIAIYTDTNGAVATHGQQSPGPRGEVLAYSHDEGRTFTYYKGNPVYCHPDTSPKGGRDPKVFWWPITDHAQTDPNGHWVMAVYSQQDGRNIARILTSPNLKQWTETDQVPDHYECIELFELPLLDQSGNSTDRTLWAIQGADGTHHLGDFDGQHFAAISPTKQRTLHLPGYAYQRFNDAPDNRVIMIGWIRGSSANFDWEDMPFNEMMTIPLELSLRETPAGPRIHANPVPELKKLSREVFHQENFRITRDTPFTLPGQGQQFDLTVTFRANADLTIALGHDHVSWANGVLNQTHPLGATTDGLITLRILVDRPLIEVFGNDGAIYLPLKRQDQGRNVSIQLKGSAEIVACRLAEIIPTPITKP